MLPSRINERTHEGRLDAMARGVKFGRKRKYSEEEIAKLYLQEYTKAQISRKVGCHYRTVEKIMARDSFNDAIKILTAKPTFEREIIINE